MIPGRSFRGPRGLCAGLLLLGLGTLPTPGEGQVLDLPTLESLGLEYLSDSGFLQLLLSGQLDLEGFHVSNEWEPGSVPSDVCDACHVDIAREFQQGGGANTLRRLRFFIDAFAGDHVYASVEWRADQGRERLDAAIRGRLEQAFVRVVTASGAHGVQVGRFASPFGSYAQRHLTEVDPFLSAPLPYDYRTVMNRWRWAVDDVGFLTWKDRPDDIDVPGAPPVWDVPYQWGAMVFGALGALDVRGAAMNSAPSSHPNAWSLDGGQFDRPSWVLAARWKASPAVEVGASYDRGPWVGLRPLAITTAPPNAPSGPPPADRTAFDQELMSADVAISRGPLMVRGEFIRNRWEVPNLASTPGSHSATVEVQTDIAAGVSIAGRLGWIDFRPIRDGSGGQEDWDYDVYRAEASLGYRLSRNVGLLLSAYRQRQSERLEGDTDFVGVRLWWAM